MGEMAEAIMDYARPLIEQTNGSPEKVQKALSLALFCWNLAIRPNSEHEELLRELREATSMSDEQFREFRAEIIEPMIHRHRQMFPALCPRQHRELIYNG